MEEVTLSIGDPILIISNPERPSEIHLIGQVMAIWEDTDQIRIQYPSRIDGITERVFRFGDVRPVTPKILREMAKGLMAEAQSYLDLAESMES